MKFKEQLKILKGHWWARVDDRKTDTETWAPVGKVENLPPHEAAQCARLARWYHLAGILTKITGPVVTCSDSEILSVVERDT